MTLEQRIDEIIRPVLSIGKDNHGSYYVRLNKICPNDNSEADCGNWCPHFFVSVQQLFPSSESPNIEPCVKARVYLGCAPSAKSFSADIEDLTCDEEEKEDR